MAHTEVVDARERFTEFVRRHHDSLHRHAAVIYPSIDAHELVNSVFAVAWRRMDDIPPGRELIWLKSVARNLALNAMRGDRRWSQLKAQLAAEPPGAAVPAADDERRLEVEVAMTALRSLSPDDQALLRLQALEELTAEELAGVLGVRVGTARTRLSRARQRLRDAHHAHVTSGRAS